MTMKNIIITYSNGDTEKSKLESNRAFHMLKETIDSGFKIAWTQPDDKGDYKRILNMQFVRSIEITDDEEPGVD
jgi:hypothetical protein